MSRSKVSFYWAIEPTEVGRADQGGWLVFAELIAAGSSVTYESHTINIMKNEQKEPWFTKLCPNGRIPLIYDNAREFAVFESAAILLYLQKHYDPAFALGFDDDNLQSEMIQWIFFQHVSSPFSRTVLPARRVLTCCVRFRHHREGSGRCRDRRAGSSRRVSATLPQRTSSQPSGR